VILTLILADILSALLEPNVESADAALQRLADVQMRRNPAMSRAQAVTAASATPKFAAAYRREKLRKFG
jgi:hypothetical protein